MVDVIDAVSCVEDSPRTVQERGGKIFCLWSSDVGVESAAGSPETGILEYILILYCRSLMLHPLISAHTTNICGIWYWGGGGSTSPP